MALSLSGCLPIPIFEVTPAVPRAQSEATFDASGTVVSNVPEDNVAVGWSWDFGDGETGRGEVVTHTYDKPGTYTVKLTVKDSAGREASIEEKLEVKEALAVEPLVDDEEDDDEEEKEETSTSTSVSTSTGSSSNAVVVK